MVTVLVGGEERSSRWTVGMAANGMHVLNATEWYA